MEAEHSNNEADGGPRKKSNEQTEAEIHFLSLLLLFKVAIMFFSCFLRQFQRIKFLIVRKNETKKPRTHLDNVCVCATVHLGNKTKNADGLEEHSAKLETYEKGSLLAGFECVSLN